MRQNSKNRSLSVLRELSGSVVEYLTRDRGAASSSLTSVTALCPSARQINPSLVLVQPRKTCPYITERLLMGRKESNQTNKSLSIHGQLRTRSALCMLHKADLVPSCPCKPR